MGNGGNWLALLAVLLLAAVSCVDRPEPAETTAGCPDGLATAPGSVAVLPVPGGLAVAPGQDFVVSLCVVSGAQAIDAVEVALSYPPDLLEVADSDPSREGLQVAAGATLPILLTNKVDDARGLISFAAGRAVDQTPPRGVFALATVRLRAKRPGTAALRFVGPNQVAFAGRGLAVSTQDGVVTVAGGDAPPAAARAADRAVSQVPSPAGLRLAAVEPRHVAAPRVASPPPSAGIASGASGMDALAGGVARLVRGAAVVAARLHPSAGAAAPSSPLALQRGTMAGVAPDVGRAGSQDPESTAARFSGQMPRRVAPLAEVTLRLSPASGTLVVGGAPLAVEIVLVTGVLQIDAVQVRITFDPGLVAVVDADLSRGGIQVTPGTALRQVLLNQADNVTGAIEFAAGIPLGGSPVAGTIVLATVSIEGKAAGTSPLRFASSEVVFGGVPRSVDVVGGTLVVTAPAGATPTPTPGAGAPTPTATPVEPIATPTPGLSPAPMPGPGAPVAGPGPSPIQSPEPTATPVVRLPAAPSPVTEMGLQHRIYLPIVANAARPL